MDPLDLVSRHRLLDQLTHLTSIRPYSGWRSCTTPGEVEAIQFVRQRLSLLGFLRQRGLIATEHRFRTYKGVEFRQSDLQLTISGTTYVVPADAQPGHHDRLDLALRFDSDGVLNDSNPDPVLVEGPPLVVTSESALEALTASQVDGRILVLDYAIVDRSVLGIQEAVFRCSEILETGPNGIVLVTRFSNRQGQSHGAFVGDANAFAYVESEPRIPILNVRIEDLSPIGIRGWRDLDHIEWARLTWDADLHEVGQSALLMARVPGLDSSRAVILGAHIDSPNTPGALDDGSGSVALLEVARVLDRARVLPPTDLYLVWFGAEEIGLYGSINFASANSELLDRTIAMLQMDGLGHPLDGIANFLTLSAWSYGRHGDDRLLWPDYLIDVSPPTLAPKTAVDYYGLGSDNSSLTGYNVPNALLDFTNPYDETQIHFANHWHDPYDTVALAAAQVDVLEDMVKIMLTAALQTGTDDPSLAPFADPDRRAVFVASHTEGAQMSPSGLVELGMTLGWEGFDVDLVPYGTPVFESDLADADLVVALPVHDYPSERGDVDLYDEAWTADEVDVLEDYVAGGGVLVLTNTAHRLKYFNSAYEENEDWRDVNALAERFGVTFRSGRLSGDEAATVGTHPLISGVSRLAILNGNGLRFAMTRGRTLANAGSSPAVAVVEHGNGEVIVIADLCVLGSRFDPPFNDSPPANLRFWRNLARYAR